jgi:hypothetical protein
MKADKRRQKRAALKTGFPRMGSLLSLPFFSMLLKGLFFITFP